MIGFIIKASLILTILWVFYKLFLQKESFFAANRVYLIACLVLTFLLPFISLPRLLDSQGFVSTIIEAADNRESLESPATAIRSGTTQSNNTAKHEPHERQSGIVDWFLWLYYFGVGVFALNFLVQIAGILIKAERSTDKVYDSDVVVINSHSVREPCSFFRYVFINPERYDYEVYGQILAHEKIHARKLHAADLMLAEIAIIILWFNPFAWLTRKEIERNIEYQTDDLMLRENEVEKEWYQMNLLKIATYAKPLAITINYNQSLIKQRIFRMNTKKSNVHSYWKYTFIAPLLLAIVAITNKPVSVLAGSGRASSAASESEQNAPTYAADCQALLRSVKDRDVEDVNELLKTVDPNCTYRGDGEPRSPLVAAARNGDLEIGRLLIDAGAEVEFHAWGDETPLMAASVHGHLDFVKYLVTRNADVNKELGGDGTALLVAAREGYLDVVAYLISRGANVNAQVVRDGTPLICAVRNGHYEVTRVLLENGADPYQVSPGDEYAMYHARMSGNDDIIALLKKYEKGN